MQINLLDKKRAYQERTFWQFGTSSGLLTFGFVFQH